MMEDIINSHQWVCIKQAFSEGMEYICVDCGTTGFSDISNDKPNHMDEYISCDDCVIRSIIE
jgi:DNA-directed RNA polymerase subunit RPC12/RpoP